MSRHGRFVNGEGSRRFVLESSELGVDCDSVSSDWSTVSESEALANREHEYRKKKERWQVRKFRVRYRLPKKRQRSDSSTSSSSSSGGSSSTSSSSKSHKGSNRAFKAQLDSTLEAVTEPVSCSKTRDCTDVLTAAREVNRGNELVWLDAPKGYRRVAVAPAFLTGDDIASLARCAKHSSVKEIHDRKQYLAFKHHVVRFEMQLRALDRSLYRRLLRLMRTTDVDKWSRLNRRTRVYPEIEYIEYDVEREGGPCYIEPHIDNKSVVTLIAMLSTREQYSGGKSCFRRDAGKLGHREVWLERGDVVMFRGEKLTHWITPVLAGSRTVLQIELSRV